ncbi:MAG: right-handed parallel beta-helix repeat-containing protein [Kiritimatiellae bacterium]|nr:right-handed parallel beta-helix repeat-containing protein [Kiritimatiellia bacterium]
MNKLIQKLSNLFPSKIFDCLGCANKKTAALFLLSLPAMAWAETSSSKWRQYAEALKAEPGLLRFYSMKTEGSSYPDLAGSNAQLTWSASDGVVSKVVPGRIEGSQVPELDAGSFRAPEITAISNRLTLSIWVKPEAAGVKQNDGRVNGMIASSGSGYYDGWRLAIYDMTNLKPSFEIGRGENSVHVVARDSLSRGCWNHLAATWDGAVMKIYVNGMLSGRSDFTGPSQPAKGGFSVGYSGYGVGSLRMAVDEVAVFNVALSAAKVAALSLIEVGFQAEVEATLERVEQLQQAGQSQEAAGALRKLAAGSGQLPALACWAEMAALEVGAKGQSRANWVNQCVELYERPATPAHLRAKLLVHLLNSCRNGGPTPPSRILEALPAAMDLSEEDQFACGVALVRSYAMERKLEQATRAFEHLVKVSVNDLEKSRNLRFTFAQILREADQNAEAEEHYAAIIEDVKQPVAARSIAGLALARTLLAQSKYDTADKAFRAVTTAEGVAGHHVYEAEAGIAVCENLKAGKAARDPEGSRDRPAALPASPVVFFVAPNGSDTNPGTRKAPFATLMQARDAIRALKKTAGGLAVGGVTVYLRGGRYTMDKPFELTSADSGQYNAPVVYAAYRKETPIFDGGFAVKKFSKVRDPETLARLPEEARGKVYCADLRAQGFKDFTPQQGYGFGARSERIRAVYADQRLMPVARWPNSTRIPIAELLPDNELAFKVESDRLARWSMAQEIMVDGFWYYLWAGLAVPVASVDPAAGVITLANKPNYGLKAGRPFFVMNLLEEIDQPGEWYIDTASGLLYIWLQKHPWFTKVVVSERQRPFIKADGVQDLIIQGLTFQYGQDRAAAFNHCVNLNITGCRFHGFGGTPLMVLNAANAKIYGNQLDTLGHGGMRVTGGKRKNLTSGGIVIENNEVGHFGLSAKTYVPAILLEGVGAKVRHNWFHHAPSSALRIEGNDHLVEYNLGEFLVQESDDQGAIDMWGNASYRGCVMRYNHWRDVGAGDAPCGQAGIRFDDAISGMVVYGNIFERTSNGNFGGVQIHGGQMNIIDNNIFIDCKHAVSFSPWSQERFSKYISEETKAKLYTEVNIALPPYSNRYPSLQALADRDKCNYNSIWRNVIVGADTPYRNAPKGIDFIDNQSVGGSASGALPGKNSTFCELPIAEIGLYADPACAWGK